MRVLHAMAVSASDTYNTAIEEAITRQIGWDLGVTADLTAACESLPGQISFAGKHIRAMLRGERVTSNRLGRATGIYRDRHLTPREGGVTFHTES